MASSPHRGNVQPAPPVGSPARARMKLLPSSYLPPVVAPQTPPSTPPPGRLKGMEDTDFNSNDAVVREGYLMKLKQTHKWATHSRWNKRWFQLRGGFLLYFKRKGMDTPAGWLRVNQIREIQPLEDNSLIPGTNRSSKHCFMIMLTTRKLFVRTRSAKECEEWMSSIITCMRAVGVPVPHGAALTPKGVKIAGATPTNLFAGMEPATTTSAMPSPVPEEHTAAAVGSPAVIQIDMSSPAPRTPMRHPRISELKFDKATTPAPKSPARWSGDATVQWVEYWDEEYQHHYFVNVETNESVWELPSEVPAAAVGAGEEAGGEAAQWVKCWDYDFDCVYYYNVTTSESSYDLPPVLNGVEPEWIAPEGDDAAVDGDAAEGKYAAEDDDGGDYKADYEDAKGEADEGDAKAEMAEDAAYGVGAGATPSPEAGAAVASISPEGKTLGKKKASFLDAAFGAAEGSVGGDTTARSAANMPELLEQIAKENEGGYAYRGAAPPTEHWVEYWNAEYNVPYYVHAVSGESSWTIPDGATVVQYDEGEYDYTQGYDPTTATYYAEA